MSTFTRYALTATTTLVAGACVTTALAGYRQARKPLAKGLSLEGRSHPSGYTQLLADLTYQQEGTTVSEQSIFAALEGLIERAQDFLVLDLFLFNSDYDRTRGPEGGYPRLAERVTRALVNKRAQAPELPIIFITDPINTFYGSYSLPHLEQLADAGVQVVMTDLDALADSNPIYSAFYRAFLARLPELPAGLPNVLAPGRPRVSPNAYARLFNFKANHRKLALSEREALVSSANPHDASAPNSNLGLLVTGPVLADILASERAIYTLSGGQGEVFDRFEQVLTQGLRDRNGQSSEDHEPVRVQLVTEGAIRRVACQMVRAVEPGGEICLGMFYLAERSVVRELKAAAQRGVQVQALLDLNLDAFGRKKTGLPALPVARELQGAGVQVRWYATSGEQFHPKYLATYRKGEGGGIFELLVGSGNFTRRNICNYNLETDLRLVAPIDAHLAQEFTAYWSLMWGNEPVAGRPALLSLPYEGREEPGALRSALHKLVYRFQEATGLGTF